MGSVHGTAAAEEHGIRRSPHWPTVEKHVLASNPKCLACSDEQENARIAQVQHATRGLQVHHALVPFHFAILLGRPDLELDARNLIVLCEDEAGVQTQDHHNLIGHLRNFRSYAPDAAGLAARFTGASREALLADAGFVALCAKLPKEWAQMTDDDKRDMRSMLDQKLPKL